MSTVEELQGQVALRQQRLAQVISELREVLRADISSYAARECKRIFLAEPSVSESLDDARVAALKADSSSLGTSAAERIDGQIADHGLWSQGADPSEPAADLKALDSVWSIVTTVQDDVAKLLSGFGFSESVSPYKAPAYFVDGRYFPSLAEHFWRLRIELSDLTSEIAQRSDDAVRSRLLARWDAS